MFLIAQNMLSKFIHLINIHLLYIIQLTNYEERDFEIKANYEYAKQYKLSLLV